MGSKNGSEGYEVGYGKPPADHRFVKGKSGNPSGKKRKKEQSSPVELQDMIFEESQRTVRVVMDGKAEHISLDRALIRMAFMSAMQGKPQSIKIARNLLDEARKSIKARYSPTSAEMKNMSTEEVMEAYQRMIAVVA